MCGAVRSILILLPWFLLYHCCCRFEGPTIEAACALLKAETANWRAKDKRAKVAARLEARTAKQMAKLMAKTARGPKLSRRTKSEPKMTPRQKLALSDRNGQEPNHDPRIGMAKNPIMTTQRASSSLKSFKAQIAFV